MPFVRERWFAGESFSDDIALLRVAADTWSSEVAGGRIHGTTRKVPREVFEAEKARDELTRRTDALDLLCGVADKVLALGRGDEAEKLLGTALANMLKQVQAGSVLAPASASRPSTSSA